MLTYHHGGATVKSGFYWNLNRWEIVTVPKEGGVLPGSQEHRYARLPILLLLAFAPVMGGLYVIFLPLIGFVMVLSFAGRKAAGALRRAFMELMTTLSPAWRPGEAYFAGKRKAREEEDQGSAGEGGKAEPLDTLEREIEARRKSEM